MALSYFLGWARLQSASVWPSALFHASHNFYFLHLFEPVEVRNTSASYLNRMAWRQRQLGVDPPPFAPSL